MRKEIKVMKTYNLKTIIASLILISSFTFSNRAHAGFAAWAFETVMHAVNKDANPLVTVTRTATDVGASLATNFTSVLLLGMNADDIGACGVVAAADAASALGDSSLINNEGTSDIFSAESISSAREAAEDIDCASIGTNKVGAKGAGSVMGVSKAAFDMAISEPLPINLAFWGKHNLQKIPVIGDTAYAQTEYPVWGIEMVLTLWEASRNVAYGLMAVIMLIIGVMIIFRKEVGRSYITVQTAIPRVVISLILITFSYPIGAIMASMVNFLIVLIYKLFFGETFQDNLSLVDYKLLLAYFPMIVTNLGVALFSLVVGILLLGLTAIAMIIASFKMLFVFIKIMFAIFFAPIQFAFAAIPGQEEIIPTWFKKMTSYVLAIPAIFFYIMLGWYILVAPWRDLDLLQSLLGKPAPSEAFSLIDAGLANLKASTTFLMLFVMSIMTMFASLKADKTVEEAIMGKQKR